MTILTSPHPIASRTNAAIRSRWLQVVTNTDPKYGGLSATVPTLGSRISNAHRIDAPLAAFCAPGEYYCPLDYTPNTMTFWPSSRTAWFKSQTAQAAFVSEVSRTDGLHVHGLWEQSTALACRTARSMGKPYILSAHGMLEPWALSNKRLKKLVYAGLIERRNVTHATCLHALTRVEADQYILFGARCPIAIVPNGVDIPLKRSSALFLGQFPELKGKRILLFLGRLHPKKGIDLLVDAWANIASLWPEAHLVIAGPDSEGTRAKLEKRIAERGMASQVSFTGMLHGEMKWSALAAAEGFVLPSYSEGLSVGVLEAMGMGLPVIITKGCNMPEVASLCAGWVIQPELAQLTCALCELLQNNFIENIEIGARGESFIQTKYGWSDVARKMADVYSWVQGGSVPASVEVIFQ